MAKKLSYGGFASGSSASGVTLPLATPMLEGWWDAVHPRDVFQEWDGWNYNEPHFLTDPIPTPSLPDAPNRKPGVLYWPNGASRPAWFHAVVNADKKDEIVAAQGDPMTPQFLTMFDDRDGKFVSALMYMLPPRPLNQLGHTDSDGWYLTFTDQRFFWYWKRGTITAAPDTWFDLYDQLAVILGITLTIDTVDSRYGVPSRKWVNWYGPTPTILDSVASQVGQRIVVALNGSVRAVNWENAKADSEAYLAAADPELSGGTLQASSIAKYVPASVRTLFLNTSIAPTPVEPYTVDKPLGSLGMSGPGYGSASGLTGYSQVVFGDTPYDGTNATAVSNYASAAAEDWYGWMLPNEDIVYPGIEPYNPTGWEDVVEWTFQIREDANGKDVPFASTQIRRGPYNSLPSGNWFAGEHPDTAEEKTCDLAKMSSGDCLAATISYQQQSTTLRLTGPKTWSSASGNIRYPLGSGFLVVARNSTYGFWTATLGGLALDMCGNKCWSGGPATDHATGLGNCTGQTFEVCVDCDCCTPLVGWDGAGWYCIRAAGTSGSCEAVELVESDRCDATIEICSGPYATEAAANAVCGGITSPCIIFSCPGISVRRTLNCVINSFPGIPNGTYTLTYDSGSGNWIGFYPSVACGGTTCQLTLGCTGVAGSWTFIDGHGSSTLFDNVPTSCSPFNISFTVAGGTFNITEA